MTRKASNIASKIGEVHSMLYRDITETRDSMNDLKALNKDVRLVLVGQLNRYQCFFL